MNRLKKSRVLTMVGFFLPGNKGGGPIRSIVNLVRGLGNEYEFLVATSDCDVNDKRPYEGISSDKWEPFDKGYVRYLSMRGRSIVGIYRLLRETQYDVLYLNSFFSREFSIVPSLLHWLGLIRAEKVILAPKGEFSEGALKIRRYRKRMYIMFANIFGVYANIFWHASSKYEKQEIIKCLGKRRNYKLEIASRVRVAVDIPTPYTVERRDILRKEKGSLRMVFLSRICRKKNLDGSLKVLDGLEGLVQYDIYGPIEDMAYWKQCQRIIGLLPENIKVVYCGEVPNDKVFSIFGKYHLFFFLTHGENYGHVILESLISACPVLISDTTPWQDLERIGVGWNVQLNDRYKIQCILKHCIDMDNYGFQFLSASAQSYAKGIMDDPIVLEQNKRLFSF